MTQDQEKIAAFVDRSANNYRDKWSKFAHSSGAITSFNWAAWAMVFILLLLIAWAGFRGIYVKNQPENSNNMFGATGPLTLAEFEANFLSHLDTPLAGKHRECVLREIEDRARAAGDPETLDPSTVELLPVDSWKALDPGGRRIILMQVITTKAMFECPDF